MTCMLIRIMALACKNIQRHQLTKHDINYLYVTVIRGMIYAMVGTHSSLVFVVGLVSWYQSDSEIQHWNCVKRVIRYHVWIVDYTLCFGGSYGQFQSYTDANSTGDLDERRLTYTYVLVEWRHYLLAKQATKNDLIVNDARKMCSGYPNGTRSCLIKEFTKKKLEVPMTLNSDNMTTCWQ